MRSCGWYYEPRLRKEDTNDQVDDSVVDACVGMATATTAIAQGCFYGHCNPEASWCRLLCGSEQQQQIEAEEQQQNARSQWAPGYVAETHHRSMYMYVPPHGGSTHLHKKAPLKKVAPY